jgi:hypothetical protein
MHKPEPQRYSKVPTRNPGRACMRPRTSGVGASLVPKSPRQCSVTTSDISCGNAHASSTHRALRRSPVRSSLDRAVSRCCRSSYLSPTRPAASKLEGRPWPLRVYGSRTAHAGAAAWLQASVFEARVSAANASNPHTTKYFRHAPQNGSSRDRWGPICCRSALQFHVHALGEKHSRPACALLSGSLLPSGTSMTSKLRAAGPHLKLREAQHSLWHLR